MERERLRTREALALVLAVASVTPTLTQELAAFEWHVEPIGGGYYRIDSHPFPGWLVVVDEVSAAERDELLQLVGHRTMETEEQDAWLLAHTVYGPKADDMERLEGYKELIEKALARMPAHLRLAGMSPEERLQGLSPAEQLLALSDELLRQLPAEFIEKQPPSVRDEIRRRIQSH